MDAATLAAAKAYANKRLNWRGAWTATTAYAKNDLVTYNGGLYRAPNAFTSGAAFVIANWVELMPQSGVYALDNPVVASVVLDGQGRMLSWTENGIAHAVTYDFQGRIATYTVNGLARTFTYNASGVLTRGA